MSWVAVGVGGAAVVGGVAGGIIQGNAAKDAAQQQADAANRATELQGRMWEDQKGMYAQQREDAQPWRNEGVAALSKLSDPDYYRDFNAGDFQKDPGYEFRMAEANKALERSAAARGGLQSGGTLKALARYNQDYASNEFNNAYNRFNADRDRRFNRLSSIAGLGQTANSQLGNANAGMAAAGQNFANQAGSNMMGAANANAAATMAQGQMWGNTLSGIGQQGMNAYWMNRQMKAQGG